MAYINGTNGPGYGGKVDKYGRFVVNAITSSSQNFVSEFLGEAYQVSTTDTPESGTVDVLHVQNGYTDGRNIIVTYIRLQGIDITAAAAADYWTLNSGQTYTSGGTAVTPVNMNFGSGNAAQGSFYGAGPTLGGTAVEFDRWYPSGEGVYNVFNKEGSIVIPPGKGLTIKYTSDEASGTIYARVSFIVRPPLDDLLL